MSLEDPTNPTARDAEVGTADDPGSGNRRHAVRIVAGGVAVVAVVASVTIPALWYIGAASPMPFRPELFWLMTGFVSIAAVAVIATLRFGGWGWTASLVLTSLVILLVFSWPALTSAGDAISRRLGLGLLADVAPVLLAGGALWLGMRLARESAFSLVIGGAVTGYAAILAVIALPLVVPTPDPITRDHAGADAADVVFLVLDGYGRADVLAENFDADVEGFLGELERHGFFVAEDATTNYPFTFAAVSSMLAGSYAIDEGPISDEELSAIRSLLSGNSGMIRDFAGAGYETRYLLNAWAGSHCGSFVDVCISGGIVGRSLWNLGRMTILSPLVDEIWRNPLNNQSVDHLTDLAYILEVPSRDDRPVFTFAHIILPHVPLRLGPDCSRTDGGPASEWGSQPELLAERHARLRAQVTCVNTLVVAALDRYLASHPDAVVVITADHGPGASLNPNHTVETVPDDALDERYPILSAYRLPGCEQEYRTDITPVNGARALMRCVFGGELSNLDDIAYWVNFGGWGDATDITARLGASP